MITWFDVPKEGMSPGSQAIIPTGKITITENGTDIDVSTYATADVNVEGGGGGDFSTAEVTVVPVIEGSPTIISVGGEFTTQSYYDDIPYTFALGISQNPIKVAIPKEVENIGLSVAALYAYTDEDDMYVFTRSNMSHLVSFDGNAEIDADSGFLIVKGDCTITVEMLLD